MTDNSSNTIFQDASRLAKQLNGPIVLARITKHQKNRTNYRANSPDEYFRISICISFFEFVNHKTILCEFRTF